MPNKKPPPDNEESTQKRPRRRKSTSPLERKEWGYDPLLGLESIKTTMSGMLGDLFALRSSPSEAPYEPPIDLFEDDGCLVMEMNLPGTPKDSVQMHAYQNLLIISGDTQPHPDVSNTTFHFKERCRGPFHRSIPLPFSIQAESIKASLRDGVLRVVLPLAGKRKGRSVQIEIH